MKRRLIILGILMLVMSTASGQRTMRLTSKNSMYEINGV